LKALFFTLLQVVAVAMLADFVAGVIHWLEDAYIREDTPWIGASIGKANTIHHFLPRYMTRNNWWQSSWDLLLIAVVVVLTAWGLGRLTWQVWLFVAIGMNANQVHKWSHRTRAENGACINFFQDLRVLQTPSHHGVHHTNPKNVRYCPITNLLNPVLDLLGFWSGLEWVLAKVFRLHRRLDASIPGNGPDPLWLPALRAEPPPVR
jgi:ubiquitin-conjugating enzyme E2 variant